MPLSYRVGTGYDVHGIVSDRPLRLGGLEIGCEFGLGGHTDGDVVLHAIIDAMLGAAGLPDIGELFPDSDPALAGTDSRILFGQALERVRENGFNVENVDITILAEAPRLGPVKGEIRATLCGLVGVEEDRISVKAKTHEGFDAVGQRQAIACQAAVLLSGER